MYVDLYLCESMSSCVHCPWSLEEDSRSPGTGVRGHYGLLPALVLGVKIRPQMFLTTELLLPSPVPLS